MGRTPHPYLAWSLLWNLDYHKLLSTHRLSQVLSMMSCTFHYDITVTVYDGVMANTGQETFFVIEPCMH